MFDMLLNEKEKAVKREVRDFVKSIPAQLLKDMDEGKVMYPREIAQEAARRKLLGLRFPEVWGGRGLGWVGEMAAIEEIGMLGASPACLYSLVSIVGEALNEFGTDEQKRKYLRPMLEGKIFCAEALTEPRGGSDFFGATTIATRDGDSFILNGQKRFVVGAEGADFFAVYAKTAPENHPHESISLFIVDRDDTVLVKHVYGLMGTRGGGAGRLLFHDSRVPAKNLIGPLNAGGLIFNRMMVPERMTSAAGSIGMAQAAIDIAARYSTKRKAFGQKIMKFQAVNFMVADSISKLDAARSLNYVAARAADTSDNPRRLVSQAKKVATETAWEVINNAMQIMGGIGYTNIYPVEKYLRDCRLSMIWTGTNEIMNLLIQHEYYKELAAADGQVRDVEQDAVGAAEVEEKIYE
ncbi:MAG: acyl-CoA dehydrogenase [Candidatus Abyssobacteria bacterium SURF_5]|uniref:Acyl-CoA dehydrogenase n=1 Tax=Abyssobacteria bacterium (strain SURF_5) TaxID=2093360 RepID=A0A3A4N6R2_ABYX5|nr:MAG: acyl-CoA dehydrogenase [Candidatus Abyssubacteria bacterium SURF_5]